MNKSDMGTNKEPYESKEPMSEEERKALIEAMNEALRKPEEHEEPTK